jgi:deoxycytidylate deaminase
MKYLSKQEEKEVFKYFEKAAEAAANSCCLRSKCGAVLVKDNEIIGVGFNSPPLNKKLEKCIKDELNPEFKSDKTCCIHAEDRALREGLKYDPKKVLDARMYFIRLDDRGEMKRSNSPYCTMCSKMALDEGIAEWALWQDNGVAIYDAEEYNNVSFNYKQ